MRLKATRGASALRRSLSALLLILGTAPGASAQTIPEILQGRWGKSETDCRQLAAGDTFNPTFIRVEAATVGSNETYCNVRSVEGVDASTIRALMFCSFEGVEEDSQITLRLQTENRVSFQWGTWSDTHQRCGGASAQSGSAPPQPAGALTSPEAVGQFVYAEVDASCRQSGGRGLALESGWLGLAGDMVIVNFHHISCLDAPHLLPVGAGFCGASQCLHRRFVLQNGQYVETDGYYQ